MLPNLSTLSLKPAPREDDLTIVCELEDDVAAKRNFEDVDDPRRQPNPFVHEANWSLETFAEFRDLTLEIELRRGEMESLMQRTLKKAQARVDSVPMQRTLNEATRAVGAGKAHTIIRKVDFDIWVTHNGMGRRFVRADNSSREVTFTLWWDNVEVATLMCEVDGIGVTDIFVGECNRKTFEMTNTLHYVYYTTSSRRAELHTVEYGAFTGFGLTGKGVYCCLEPSNTPHKPSFLTPHPSPLLPTLHLRKSRTPFHACPVRVPFWWELRRFALLNERANVSMRTKCLAKWARF
jgi:hypothetical protein